MIVLSASKISISFIVFFYVCVFVSTGTAGAQIASTEFPVIFEGDFPLNETVSGEMGSENVSDFYRLRIPESGLLTLTMKGPIRTRGRLILYDINGKTEIDKIRLEGRDPGIITAGLLPGDYFVEIERTDEEWSYQLEIDFVDEPASDPEPNNSWFDASALTLGQTTSGHLGYRRDGWIDRVDWWTFTVEDDGIVTVRLEPVREEARGELCLLDDDGAQELTKLSIEGTDPHTISFPVSPGTFFLRLDTADAEWGYSVYPEFTPAPLVSIARGHHHWTSAVSLAPGEEITGRLGFTASGYLATEDWYRVQADRDGVFRVNLFLERLPGETAGQGVLRLFSPDWSQEVNDSFNLAEGKTTASVELDPFPLGEYFVNVERTEGAWAYTLETELSPQELPEEPFHLARAVLLNGSDQGSIDDYNHTDWWTVTTDQNGILTVSIEADGEMRSDFRLYDTNGTRQLANQYIGSTTSGELSYPLQPGTYYIEIARRSGRSEVYSYTLSTALEVAPLDADPEWNNHPETAVHLDINGLTSGHIGYATNWYTDTEDWYVLEIPGEGTLIAGLAFSLNPRSDLEIYDGDLNRLNQVYVNSLEAESISADVQEAGTYYVRIARRSGRDEVYSYLLATTYTPPSPAAVVVLDTYPPMDGIGTIHDFVFVYLSRPLDKTSLNRETFTVLDEEGNTLAGTIAQVGAFAVFYSDWPLEPGTSYTASLDASVHDHDGNPLGQSHTWSFTAGIEEVRIQEVTIPDPPVDPSPAPPEVPSVPQLPPPDTDELPPPPPVPDPVVSPWEDWPVYTNIPADRAWSITFSEDLDPGTVNTATVFVASDTDGLTPLADITVTVDMENRDQVLVSPPDDEWEPGETYYLFITEDVRSAIGSILTQGVRMAFTIEAPPEPYEILSIFNELLSFPAVDGPPEPSTFTLDDSHIIKRMETFHFPPPPEVGYIGLRAEDGSEFGPWDAIGKPGPGDMPDVFWEVKPEVLLPPGTYQVTVSHPHTWSFNEESGNRGFVTVEGFESAQ